MSADAGSSHPTRASDGASGGVAVDGLLTDEVARCLEGALAAVGAVLDARAAARAHLDGWCGVHRDDHAARSVVLERALVAGAEAMAAQLARLRAVRDAAAPPPGSGG